MTFVPFVDADSIPIEYDFNLNWKRRLRIDRQRTSQIAVVIANKPVLAVRSKPNIILWMSTDKS